MTSYFKKKNGTDYKSVRVLPLNQHPNPTKKCKTAKCPGFFYEKNSDVLPLHNKY